ncbi:uncharacterized protein MONOS_7867 [Monocercomonoides exilis]|uniref:uncharacterized protein n=1 Tax=Monocercomonoides exilis TaxID=2049356 RepID=UPI00355ACCAC|nr:hypothetical protein MONOS_7867 [Monocercomonoides exilis]|eukprot:MONOS_7867.1-p1 / transcript=MONOS_7867.1 / gene=MONOS_7867 / organism=Monocercomonoides_exilis_PA203 / gene_product=unspecified product / transcript_product=unspecified product / location=Mono_scaffold00281:867-1874(-) / protein_length=298 / sequence_SO=supercontig / SO=protein_coding / is_pseudo=false
MFPMNTTKITHYKCNSNSESSPTSVSRGGGRAGADDEETNLKLVEDMERMRLTGTGFVIPEGMKKTQNRGGPAAGGVGAGRAAAGADQGEGAGVGDEAELQPADSDGAVGAARREELPRRPAGVARGSGAGLVDPDRGVRDAGAAELHQDAEGQGGRGAAGRGDAGPAAGADGRLHALRTGVAAAAREGECEVGCVCAGGAAVGDMQPGEGVRRAQPGRDRRKGGGGGAAPCGRAEDEGRTGGVYRHHEGLLERSARAAARHAGSEAQAERPHRLLTHAHPCLYCDGFTGLVANSLR